MVFWIQRAYFVDSTRLVCGFNVHSFGIQPAMLSEDTRSVEEHSYDIEYTQMQLESMKTACSLYSVSSGSLPSHFRSITPKPEVHFTMENDACKQPPRCGTRTVYIILAAIFIVSSSVAVAVTVHEIRAIQEESAVLPARISLVPNYMHLNDTESDTTTLVDLETADRGTITTAHVESPSVVDPRTNCFKKCTMYGKPKFDSRCEAGFCVCRGNDFQKNTCLPSVDGCVIEKVPHSQTSFIWDSATTAYSCNIHSNSRQTSDVYVVSIYGNHFSEATVVNMESDEDVRDAFIVVLASHYPVRWKLNHNNLPISGIILVSSNSLSASQAAVVNHATPDTTTPPTVRNEYLPVGYGDDRYHSNTVEMLRNLTDIVGPITSFLGSSYADTIFLKI